MRSEIEERKKTFATKGVGGNWNKSTAIMALGNLALPSAGLTDFVYDTIHDLELILAIQYRKKKCDIDSRERNN